MYIYCTIDGIDFHPWGEIISLVDYDETKIESWCKSNQAVAYYWNSHFEVAPLLLDAKDLAKNANAKKVIIVGFNDKDNKGFTPLKKSRLTPP